MEGKQKNFIQQNKGLIAACLLMGILPVLTVLLYLALQGVRITDFYLPGSYWNDELFYYKQVEGILSHGIPQGYFGFNESHARMLTFGVWSPVLFLPWILWGLLFGWNLYSPVLCNLVLAMVVMIWFTALVRPKPVQCIWIGVLYCCFQISGRYILSCSPEIFCSSMVLLYLGFFCAYYRRGKSSCLWKMTVLLAVLCLLRPYYLVLITLPLICCRDKRQRLTTAAGGVAGLIGFVVLRMLLSAPYLVQNVGGGFLQVLRTEGVWAGVSAFGRQTCEAVQALYAVGKDALKYGNQCGSLYLLFGLLTLICLIVAGRKRHHGEKASWAVALVLANALMLLAIIYLYTVHNGDRHLLSFLYGELLCFVILYQERYRMRTAEIVLTVVLVFLYLFRQGNGYDRAIPVYAEERGQSIAELAESLQSQMQPVKENRWDNTVVWLAYDRIDGEIRSLEWQQLYALPGGFGINYCTADYVTEHWNVLQCGYVAALPGGDVEKLLLEEGATLLAANEQVALYDRRNAKRR